MNSRPLLSRMLSLLDDPNPLTARYVIRLNAFLLNFHGLLAQCDEVLEIVISLRDPVHPRQLESFSTNLAVSTHPHRRMQSLVDVEIEGELLTRVSSFVVQDDFSQKKINLPVLLGEMISCRNRGVSN